MVVGKIEERIKKMKEAIETEAKQRALHIVQRAEEEANIERVNIIKEEKDKIDIEFSRLHKTEKVRAKIQKSSVVNHQRIRKMQERHRMVEELKEELKNRLRSIVADQSVNRELTKKLIVQGLLRLMERNVSVEGSVQNRTIIKESLSACEKDFSRVVKEETGKDLHTTLVMSEYCLEDQNKSIIGGVFLRSSDGLIVCDNSLDARVRLIFEHLLPQIRMMVFNCKQGESKK